MKNISSIFFSTNLNYFLNMKTIVVLKNTKRSFFKSRDFMMMTSSLTFILVQT